MAVRRRGPDAAGIDVATPVRAGSPWYIGQSAAAGGVAVLEAVVVASVVVLVVRVGVGAVAAVVLGAVGGELARGSPPLEVQPATSSTSAIGATRLRISPFCRVVLGDGTARGRDAARRRQTRSRTAIVSSRPGPTPIAEIGALIIFSSAAT